MKTLALPGKLVKMRDYIYATTHAAYSPHYRPIVLRRLDITERALAHYKRVLDIYPKQELIIKPAGRTRFNAAFMLNNAYIFMRPDLRMDYYLLALAHECVHVEQFKRGDLSYEIVNDKFHVIWKGESYPYDRQRLSRELNKYVTLPWEAEAYGREYDITKSFIETLSWREVNDLQNL